MSSIPPAQHVWGANSTTTVAAPQVLPVNNTGLLWSPAANAATFMATFPQQQMLYPMQQQMLQPTQQLAGITTLAPSQGQQPMHTTVFFAGVTPIADWQKLRQLFSNFGSVVDLNLFRPYNGCRTSKGCGLVVFSQHSEAAAALQALNGRFVWPGARSPMVIEWCDPSKQHKKKRAQPLAHTLIQQPAHVQQLTQLQYAQQPLLSQQLPAQHHQQQLPAQQVQQPYFMGVLPQEMPLSTQEAGLQMVYVNQNVY